MKKNPNQLFTCGYKDLSKTQYVALPYSYCKRGTTNLKDDSFIVFSKTFFLVEGTQKFDSRSCDKPCKDFSVTNLPTTFKPGRYACGSETTSAYNLPPSASPTTSMFYLYKVTYQKNGQSYIAWKRYSDSESGSMNDQRCWNLIIEVMRENGAPLSISNSKVEVTGNDGNLRTLCSITSQGSQYFGR